jgi:16S rRNA (cytosine1402-N4)-methyltransferase
VDELTHIPVLPRETVELLAPKPGQVYVDATAGLGGHAALIAPHIGAGGTIVLNDLDEGNLKRARARLEAIDNGPRVLALRGNFAEVPRRLVEQGIVADMVLADLGFASPQVDDGSRGLSFSKPGPLDMRLDPTGPLTCAQLIASAGEGELERIIREFGEERHARLIAKRIVEKRSHGAITTTEQLATIVRGAVGPRGSGGIDPATRTFQALRIAVNDEIGNLQVLLDAIARQVRGLDRARWLAPGARVALISFHSLEDRPVKQCFGPLVEEGKARAITKKPITASEDEERSNPRSRSAKLRVIEVA